MLITYIIVPLSIIPNIHNSTIVSAIVITLLLIVIRIQYMKIKNHTNHHKMKESVDLHLLHLLINNMPDFIYIKDLQSRFVIGNKYLANMINVNSTDTLIGKTDFDYYPHEMAQKFFDDEQKIISSGISMVNIEEQGLDSIHQPIIVSTTKVPWFDENGKIKGIIGIGRNITSIKKAENDLVIQTNNLKEVNILLEERHEQIQQQAEELLMQAENLKELNKELQKTNETKDKFISIIAHDLKNPFNAIINFSELLLLKFGESMQPKQIEMVRIINSSSKMAYSLLENMLFWAKTQTSTIPCRPGIFDISEQIKEVIDFLDVSAKLKNIIVINEAASCLHIFSDVNMVSAILRNLLCNAIKFTQKNGEIRISSTYDGEYGYITITDSGIGMNENQLKNLFSKDKDIIKGTSGEAGTGLGLILCIEFAKQNGGTIFVKSELGKGSTFILSLPLHPVF
jgi:PAS domain S-box-containing protein